MLTKNNLSFSLIFIIIVFAQEVLMAQSSSQSIPLKYNIAGRPQLQATYQNTPLTLALDSSSTNVQLTVKELKQFQQNKLTFQYSIDTVNVANKKRVDISFVMDSITIGCIVLYNVPAKVSYKPPYYDPNAEATIGIKILNSAGILRYTKAALHVSNISSQNLLAKCQPKAVTQQKTTNASLLSGLQKVKIIPCSIDPALLQKKGETHQLLQALGCMQIEEETQLPPRQKAIARVAKGYTIRYFDNQDLNLVNALEKALKKQFSSSDIHKENMLAAFNNQAISSYIEIWIK